MSDSLSNPSSAQYQPQQQISVPPAQHTAGPNGQLPFSGADAFILIVVSAALVTSGFVLNRLSRQRRR